MWRKTVVEHLIMTSVDVSVSDLFDDDISNDGSCYENLNRSYNCRLFTSPFGRIRSQEMNEFDGLLARFNFNNDTTISLLQNVKSVNLSCWQFAQKILLDFEPSNRIFPSIQIDTEVFKAASVTNFYCHIFISMVKQSTVD